MHIGIVLHPYGEKMPGGLPRMILQWTTSILQYGSEHRYTIFLKEEPKTKPDLPGDNWEYKVLGGGRFWLDRIKRYPEIDTCLFNTPVLPMFFTPKNSIVISLDFPYKYLKPKSLRDWYMKHVLSFYHKRSLRRADKIVAISHTAKEDTMKLFGIAEEKIVLIPHGYTDISKVEEVALDLPDKYFFFAGTLKERKNVLRIVQATETFIQKYPDTGHKLVIAGKNQGSYYEMLKTYIDEHDLNDRVVFLGHINDGQLSYAYKRAEALIFPSLIEATGNPIIESMYCGTPVITSNINGPAELGANDSAILVDPYKTEEIVEGMKKLVFDETFRCQRIKNGFAQVKRFSWEQAARNMLQLMETMNK